jgi:hypothetical protein
MCTHWEKKLGVKPYKCYNIADEGRLSLRGDQMSFGKLAIESGGNFVPESSV